MAFCTTIRRRSSFASIVPALCVDGFLKENNLNSHDISIPLTPQSNNTTALASRHLRVLLLSARALSEDAQPQTIERLRRFAALTGGTDLAIIFLLALPKNARSTGEPALIHNDTDSGGIIAYSQLQVLLHAHKELPTIPVLPLASIDHLPTLLKKHVSGMTSQHTRSQQPKALKPWDLLRSCTMNPPMDETMAYCITDVFTNLQELALACSTEAEAVFGDATAAPSSDPTIGRDEVSPYFSSSSGGLVDSDMIQEKSELAKKLCKLRALNEEAARDVVMFWQAEWLID